MIELQYFYTPESQYGMYGERKKKTTLSKLHTERHKWCQTYTRHTQTIWNTISLLAERKCGSLVLVNRAVLGLLYVLSEHKDIFVVFMYSKKAYFKYTLVYIKEMIVFLIVLCSFCFIDFFPLVCFLLEIYTIRNSCCLETVIFPSFMCLPNLI